MKKWGLYGINGLLNVLKPPGMTSFDVVAYLRGILKEKKIGHAGTLDPCAAGVLPVCLGKATKVIEYIMDMEKVYRAELSLGISTDTQDSTGNIIAKKEVNVSAEDIFRVVKEFTGEIYQIPPMYSAVRVGGRRLYEIAREGKSVERNPRKIFIRSIEIINICKNKVLMDVTCSKGTYIRTLCSDIGDRLGCGGHMSFLIRKRTGIFDIESAYTLEEILSASNSGKIQEITLNTDKLFENLDSIHLSNKETGRFLNGGFIPVNRLNQGNFLLKENLLFRVYNEENIFLGLGRIIKEKGLYYIKPDKLFC